MRKIILLLLAAVFLMSSCSKENSMGGGSAGGSESTDNGGDTGNAGNTGDTGNSGDTGNTGGSDNGGNGSGTDSGSGGDVGTNEDTGRVPVDKVETAEDVVSFIDANIYGKCADVLPMMVETRVLSGEETDSITYNTGLTDTTGITDIILSESGIGSFAYSLVYLRTDGTNTEELQNSLGSSINPSKWVCVTAESIKSITLDDDILLVMGGAEQTDTILNAAVAAADGIFENIGSVVSFG